MSYEFSLCASRPLERAGHHRSHHPTVRSRSPRVHLLSYRTQNNGTCPRRSLPSRDVVSQLNNDMSPPSTQQNTRALQLLSIRKFSQYKVQ